VKALCLDFGNTFCKLATMQDGVVVNVIKFAKQDALAEVQKMQLQFGATHSIISSVVNNVDDVLAFLNQHTSCIQLSHLTKLPFAISYKTPHTLGKDRLALIAQAQQQFPTEACLVLACGTCITYNYLNSHNLFVGGGISPGLHMRIKALQHYTQQLPLIDNVPSAPLIGTDTISSMQSGVINGLCAEIDGIIQQYQLLEPKINVVLTGGDATQLALLLKSRIFADANFLFKGLYTILQFSTS
jgi:type III pantothenate kinase